MRESEREERRQYLERVQNVHFYDFSLGVVILVTVCAYLESDLLVHPCAARLLAGRNVR